MSHTDLHNAQNLPLEVKADENGPEVIDPANTTLAKTNTFALVAIVLAFIQPIAAIVFGHLSMKQIKANGDSGRGLALTALIVGYVYTAFLVSVVLAYVAFFIFWAFAIGSAASFGVHPNSYGW